MLKKTERLTIYGNSIIDGVEAMGFQAQIDSANPENMTLSNWQTNPAAYKENRDICRADQAEFEDYVYSIQDEMLAAKSNENTESVEEPVEEQVEEPEEV